ncbi:MAG: M15 family metallopeptidase [Acidobacteriota bacterium]|nr:M15 family metallopeptidase [Reyranella sp.]
MAFNPSFIGKSFVVSDSDARIRDPNNLAAVTPKVILKGTKVLVTEVKTLPTGSKSRMVFANTTSESGSDVGWTSTRNLQGSFINETLDLLPAGTSVDQKGPNAAWSHGDFLGQVDLVEIVDNGLEIERMTLTTVEPYLMMVEAAKAAGISVAINSGFRSYGEQDLLFRGFKQGLPGFNLAAPPGMSNHQNGIALDIAVSGGAGTPVYNWLAKNATSFGFVRTVSGEPWHWEFDPKKAATAKAQGTCKAAGISN